MSDGKKVRIARRLQRLHEKAGDAIKWAKKVQEVKLDAARDAASSDEFAAMRLLSEANGAERVVETLEAALEASATEKEEMK